MSDTARPIRRRQGTPHCWQAKAALRRIREAFDATHDVDTALAVYVALTEIASDEQSEEFRTTHAWIAAKAGVGISTVQRRVKVLAEIGLVEISTPDLRAPSKYRLLEIGHHDRTFGHGAIRGPRPTYKESDEESDKESKKGSFFSRHKTPGNGGRI